MRVFLALLTFLASWPSALRAADPSDGALRVLYFDALGSEQSAKGTLHDYMAALGRDAIWFDYAAGPTPSAATLGYYDALLVKGDVPGLGSAIFWHVRQPDGRPTEGCVAMERDVLARWLDAMAPGDAVLISAE